MGCKCGVSQRFPPAHFSGGLRTAVVASPPAMSIGSDRVVCRRGQGERQLDLQHAFAGGASWADVLAKRDELQPHVPARVYYGFLRTSDGMISIAAMARPLRMKMMEVVGFDDRWSRERGWEPEDARAYTAALYGTVEEILRTDTTENWHRKLSSAGIPCGPMRLREQLLDDEQVRENGFVVRMEHATLGGLTVVAPPVAFSETPLAASTASPQLGQHTREVLLESGLDAGTVDRLAARGAIRSP